MHMRRMFNVAAMIALVALARPATAQDRPLPPGTNPAQRSVYPAGGQDVDEQQRDQLECYWWASDQIGGWDPYVAHRELQEKGYVAAEQAADAQGGLVRGAAGGALAGVAIGAIAGDAGKGAAIGAVAGGLAGGSRSRRQMADAQGQAEAAINAFNEQMQRWDKGWVTCMQGRGYTVN